MRNISRKLVQCNLKRRMQRSVLILRRCIRCFCDQFLMCSRGKPIHYRMLPHSTTRAAAAAPLPSSSPHATSTTSSFASPPSQPSPSSSIVESSAGNLTSVRVCSHDHGRIDSDHNNLVSLKISLLGDCNIGKTSFLEKYVGNEKEQGITELKQGLNLMDKTLVVEGARISYSIWEVSGDAKSQDHLPIACQDAIAICIMFDLTSRCTLNSVVRWYQQARSLNQNAIPILIGTKFDDFIQLPIDLQWTIASQARAYAKAFNATLFFSSASYNINVNKIFKFITAKLFDLPWTLERNLTIGEPIIDF
ncbi:hypothetical protein Dsin_031645 [Dipteronia sinensis]|uniref:Septum-promoting GTP-binding protein 1 n=1 Tax=Dipteronia sinensis TaxID=43782 RepID=A0AAD9ZNA3_9ROSI|nr:hypothetical protein Dsin_031645 [Dipteronia sinensis]